MFKKNNLVWILPFLATAIIFLFNPLTFSAKVSAQSRIADPLPSWNQGTTKQAIIGYVQQVTDPAKDSYILPADRIATFDNDGTALDRKTFIRAARLCLRPSQSLSPSTSRMAQKKNPLKAFCPTT